MVTWPRTNIRPVVRKETACELGMILRVLAFLANCVMKNSCRHRVLLMFLCCITLKLPRPAIVLVLFTAGARSASSVAESTQT